MAYTRRISDVFQDNYSGMTCSLLILNAPWVFSKGWQVVESEWERFNNETRHTEYQQGVGYGESYFLLSDLTQSSLVSKGGH